jgi:purine nucleosidase
VSNGQDAAGRRAVVLTTDCGTEMDDQWAVAHLVLCAELDLRGIVTNHAPNLAAPAAETAARVVAEVLDQVSPAARPPVLAGSSGPLPDGQTPQRNQGVEFILDQARTRTADDRLVVLAIGAATDVASALLVEPSLVDRIEVVAMGFDGWPGGGDVWNVRNDIPAWQTLMASGVPLTVGDAAVCIKRLTLSGERGRSLLAGCGNGGEYLVRLLVDFIAAEADMAHQVTGNAAWPVWDEVVVAHLLGLTSTETYPRPTVRDDTTLEHSSADGGDRSVTWITDVDGDRLWADLKRRLTIGQVPAAD